MTVFGDTSALLAILHDQDLNHAAAAAAWRSILESGDQLLTTNYVIVETVSLLHRRFGVRVARRFVEDVLPLFEVVWIEPEVHAAALRAALAGSRDGPSFVDCVSFEVIGRRGADRVLAYDRHFEQQGYDLCR